MSSPLEEGLGEPKVGSGTQFGDASVCTKSWILWASSAPEDCASIHEEVDRIFSTGFSFYPEKEWKAAGFPPPDGHQVLGAWRDPEFRGFVFLLDNPGMKAPPGTVPHLLTYDGDNVPLIPLVPQINRLKKTLSLDAARRKSDKYLRTRLKQADTSASFKKLLALMGSITAIINVLALYLRKLPPPVITVRSLFILYNILVPLVHIAALVLLLLFAIIFLLFTAKYASLLIRKL
jgi:hypothetical protein